MHMLQRTQNSCRVKPDQIVMVTRFFPLRQQRKDAEAGQNTSNYAHGRRNSQSWQRRFPLFKIQRKSGQTVCHNLAHLHDDVFRHRALVICSTYPRETEKRKSAWQP